MMSDARHECFTVDSTAYLRNLDRADRARRCVAIHYQPPPVANGNGSTSISLRAPILIVSLWLEEPDEIAARVARILNDHWDEAA